MDLKYGHYTSGFGRHDNLYLNVFTTTSLFEEGFIEVATLEEFMKYGKLDWGLQISQWNNEKKQAKHSEHSLRTLLSECAEIRAFASKYYPELAI